MSCDSSLVLNKDPFTSLFAPPKQWPDLVQEAHDWIWDIDEDGVPNIIKMEETACKRAGRYVSEQWTDEQLENAGAQEAMYEFKIGCPRNIALPFPTRDKTFGYSWPAWCTAAETAGSRLPPFSLKEAMMVAESCIDYWHSQIIEWNTQPEAFNMHIREISEPVLVAKQFWQDLEDINHPHTIILNRRVRDVFEGYCFWHNIKATLQRLKDHGLAEGGQKATLQVMTPGLIRDEWAKLQFKVLHLEMIVTKALQVAFATGRGRNLVEPYDDTPFFKRFDCYPEKLLYYLKPSSIGLRESSYLDFLLAGICELPYKNEKKQESYRRSQLEFEQGVKDHPEWLRMIGNHMQRLIGEKAMINDFILSTGTITKGGILLKKGMNINFIAGLEPQIKMIEKIFEYRTPASHEFECLREIQKDLGERLWNQWNIYAKRTYGKDLYLLFDLKRELARWNPPIVNKPQLQLPIFDDNDGFTRPGHSYLQSQSDHSPRNKVKTRPNIASGTEAQVVEAVPDESVEVMDVTEITLPDHDIPGGKFAVNNKQLKLVRRLFSAAEEVAGQGQVKWADIYKLMKRIGFRIDEVGGSIIRFVPPNNAGRPFSEHRPHPEITLHAIKYRAFGERLKRRYGWSLEWFERVKQDD
ncbi:uncharacterized protein L201_005286 [Kwoniella dendrophila CBS 6074]|uniref:Uncharacterized protein n=1 Tax=Kwoniella dendrophila CBS 6074 TaxID=1295534 RepID=A0AAX4JZT0_9TREE